MSEPEDRDLVIIKRFVAQLMEHFDTVEIFCTREDGEAQQTAAANSGNGNWYARYGQIREWVEREQERISIHMRRTESESDGED